MLPKKKTGNQTSFFFTFEDTLNQKHPLVILANKFNWALFDEGIVGDNINVLLVATDFNLK